MNIILFSILGFLTALLFPPFFFFPMGFIILPYLCHIIDKNYHKLNKKIIFKSSFAFGFCFFIFFLFWMHNPFFIFEETKNLFYSFIFVVIFFALIISIISTIIITYNKIIPVPFLLPVVFIISEYVISVFAYGFPWINFSLIISSNEYILFFIKNYGTLVTSYVIIQVFCLPYLFIKHNIKTFKSKIFLSIIFIPLIFFLFFNYNSLDLNKDKYKKIEVEIIQLNLKNNFLEKNPQSIFKKIINKINNSNANIIIFAENNYPFLVEDINFKKIRNNLKTGQTVIIGATRKDDEKFFNTLFNISRNEIQFFDKKVLVPFGEFLPLRNLFGFLDFISGPTDYSKGNKERVIKLNKNLNYVPVICYEIIFYWKLINEINFDSDMIINITNDIWFGKYLGPYQHFYISKLRSVEFNKPLIRVSNNGISGIINQNGKILVNTNLNETKSIKHKITIDNKKNFYNTHFLLKIYFFIILLLLILINLFKQNEY